MKRALIAGATGLVGGELLQLITKDNYYHEVKVLTRRRLNLDMPRAIEIIVSDFDKLHEHEAQLEADDIFCCLGTTMKKAGSKENFKKVDLDYPAKLAQIAARLGASRFLLVSAMGADENSLFFYSRVKAEAEQAVKKAGIAATLIFRPSLLLGPRQEKRFGEQAAQALSPALTAILAGPLKKYRPIRAREVASGMLIAAQKPLEGVHIFNSEEIKRL